MLFSIEKQKEGLRHQARYAAFLLAQAVELLTETENRLHVLDLVADPELSEEFHAFSDTLQTHLRLFQDTLGHLSKRPPAEPSTESQTPEGALRLEIIKDFGDRTHALQAAIDAAKKGTPPAG